MPEDLTTPQDLDAVLRESISVVTGGSGQCSVCSGWFDDWDGGVCDACANNGNGLFPGSRIQLADALAVA